MKPSRFLSIILALGLGLTLTLAVFEPVGLAAPGNPILDPPPNSHTAPLTTSISITYDEPISPATVTSHTFAIHAMQSGLVTATHSVSGGTIVVTPTLPFHHGELVYAIATTQTLSITGTGPLSSTQWQFRAGQLINRDFGRFRDIKAGLYGVYLGSVAWGDYDDDGDLDILLTGESEITMPFSLLYRNDGGSFTDAGIWLTGVRYGSSAWGDYDNDGDMDILLTGQDNGETPTSLIYRNDAGDFTDIGAGLAGVYASSVAWGDYDNDGDLDILLTGKNDGETPISLVYRNDAGVFTDIGAGLPGVCIGSVAWGDYDNDGDLDILLTGDAGEGPLSLVFRNDAGVFTDIGAGLPGVYGSSVAWGDYDNDGDLDILLTGDYGGGPLSLVFRNDAGVFTYVDISLTGVRWGSSAWGDYDNDGDLDILLTGFDASWSPLSLVYRNDAEVFTDIEAGLPGVCVGSVAWGDYDNDGDLDILLSGENGGDPITRIYRNEDHVSDLVLVKALTPEIAAAGDNITYTLTFFNDGSLTATHVIITDTIPVSVAVSSIVSSGVAITDTGVGPEYAWKVADLPAGAGGVITITGVLSATLPRGVFTNTAIITTTSPEADPANNRSSAPLDVYAWRILGTHPSPNASGVPLSDAIAATFSGDLDSSTATNATFAVHGMLSGLVTGGLDYDALERTLTLTPSRPFHAGEVLRVSATTSLLRTDGESLLPYQWQFRAGPVFSRCFGGFADAGVGLPTVASSTGDWGDYDNDGDLDLLLIGWGVYGPSVATVYRNDGGSFTDIHAGLPFVRPISGAWGDYDNDGDLDILLAGGYISRVYRNNAGHFVDINAGLVGVEYGSVAWGDYDNDGDLDILLTGYDGSDSISKVYRNDAGGFTDIGAQLPGTSDTLAAWGDYDNDGDLDVLLTAFVDLDRLSLIYRNDAGKFIPVDVGPSDVSADSAAWGDYDNDGDLDILLTGSAFGAPVSHIYRNHAGHFTDIGAGLPHISQGWVAWGDYDNDGDLDVLLTGRPSTNSAVSRVYRNDGGNFVDIDAGLVGVSGGEVAWGDYDNDGDLDILLTGYDASWYGETRIYRNEDCPPPDLSILKSVTPQVAAPGQIITYTLAFSYPPGSGVVTASDVVISDSIPVSVTDTSVISSGVVITQTSPGYVWQVQNLTPGQGGIITITGVVSPGLVTDTLVANTATITSSTPDADLANNSDVATLTVTVPHLPRLSISKSGPATALTGEPITYTLTITNSGTAPATNPVITDVIPAHAYYITGGTCVGGVISWSVDSLGAFNGTTQVTFSVTATQVITNSDYRVSVDGGYSATGSIPISTVIQPVESGTSLYLPLILRE
jgi:uncharacterized repeat protein (TIGR01451 family)